MQASGEALLLEIFKDKLDKPCPEMVADPALGQGLNWMIYHSHFHPLVLVFFCIAALVCKFFLDV